MLATADQNATVPVSLNQTKPPKLLDRLRMSLRVKHLSLAETK